MITNRYYLVEATTSLGTYKHWVINFSKSEFLSDHYPYADQVELKHLEISKLDYQQAVH